MKTVFMFSGQGSQYYHMGSKLYDANPVFRREMDRLDAIVKAESGRSVVAELYNEQHKFSVPFLSLPLTHPAIFMVEYAMFKTLESEGITPDYVLGSSLGEFA
ncbi:MAG: acyltransferase domain-containing protein, partial [Bacteroidota bacterium]